MTFPHVASHSFDFHGRRFVAALILAAGAVSALGQGAPQTAEEKPLTSRMSVKQVKEAAAAKARANGFSVQAGEPWSVALQVTEKGYNWSAHLVKDGAPAPYWLHVDDATGQAEFVMPMVHLGQKLPPNSDWLIKTYRTLTTTRFPIRLESLLHTTSLANAQPSGGGGTPDGRAYLENTLRDEKDSPARFEVRCYHSFPQRSTDPLIVTSVEFAYIDAALYRYRLIRAID